ATCRASHGAPVGRMAEALIDTYWRAKTERADVTRALYRSVIELDNEAVIETFARRVDAAAVALLPRARYDVFHNVQPEILTLVTVIFVWGPNAF
ncbi:MAG: TetR/AcrR family transcriptional regulator, partial [Rhizobium sp.]|nr:TetR/AcrR family transcriptional regulator [Rhizobium sp.]